MLRMRACGGYHRDGTSHSPRELMTTISGPTKSFIWLCAPARSLQALAVALLLVLPLGVTSSYAVPSASANGAHVYMLRGILNIFSLGLDDIASKLESQGIPVTVINYIGWA